jgi:hypothetical protein
MTIIPLFMKGYRDISIVVVFKLKEGEGGGGGGRTEAKVTLCPLNLVCKLHSFVRSRVAGESS